MNDTAGDDFLWLEDIDGERALAWVRERNAESRAALEGWSSFDALRGRLRAILDSPGQIPHVRRRGDALYNFWRDAAHPRGLWRRCTLAEYRKPDPAWQTLIDLDALAAAEGENWVWAGASGLAPEYSRWLVALSRGGADAVVVREFDSRSRAFVADGFRLPQAKSDLTWLDADTVYVATDTGAGSLTDSGYPRTIRRWRRGQPLAAAPVVFEAERQDMAASVEVDRSPGFERTVMRRATGMFHDTAWLLEGERLHVIDKPDDASAQFWRQHLLLWLRSDWTVAGRSWPAGALLAADAAAYRRGERRFEALFTPTPTRSLQAFDATHGQLLLSVLDNVAGRIEQWRHAEGPDGGWHGRELDAPRFGSLSVTAWHEPLLGAADPLAEHYALNASDFLSPDRLLLGHTGSAARDTLKTLPAHFDAAGMRVEQLCAASKDGTAIPYFVIWPRGALADGRNPTLLYGYGGFEVSLEPAYSGTRGAGWLERGGVLVIANIRGGGEFGPAWHAAAVREHKQRSYDDFIAVAEDLIARRISTARQLGIQGGSNGGLLVGAVMLQRPELFRAVVCQVPLLDMRRYHRLLAGASWIDEYGNPDVPEDWAFIGRYSPYQNVAAAARLPAVLFTTSTRDDRVHPGHARKMAARMRQLGHELLYYENIEGGHGGAADNAQRADMLALEFSFLWSRLAQA